MQNKQIFVDTNLLVYAHDRDAADRHEKAKALVAELWRRPMLPAISVQVLQELYVNLIRKQVSDMEARETIADYRTWYVVENDAMLLMEGIEIRERLQSSFWDGLILAAAKRARAGVIWSEDFNTGQDYDGVVAVNPLIIE
ncbi:MAG: PIN domain-containing protein [Gemmatimonadetes bacterium]|jgi:predicted nucleic acid-binding protein|nr:PIN domain-containing protein [Gemmatimonadota bacterium]